MPGRILANRRGSPLVPDAWWSVLERIRCCNALPLCAIARQPRDIMGDATPLTCYR
jgi:hypothetical protein